MKKVVAEGTLQFRPSMTRYSVAGFVRLALVTGFWLLVWTIFGISMPNVLLFMATFLAFFVLSFIGPFLILIEVEYGRIEGPDGLASSEIGLDEVDWSRSIANSVMVHIFAFDGRTVFASRTHFSGAELEEIFRTFTGGNSVDFKSNRDDGERSDNQMTIDC